MNPETMKIQPMEKMMTTANMITSMRNRHIVSLSLLRHHLSTYFHLNKDVIDLCSEYRLLYWQPEYFFRTMKDGKIDDFQVIYIKHGPAVLRKCNQVKLSFRKAHKNFGPMAYVLVTSGD